MTDVSAPKPVPNPPPDTAEKLKPDAEPKPEGAAAEVLSDAANEKEEAVGAGEAPNPEGGGTGDAPNPEGGGAVEALPKPEGGGADTEGNPDAGAAKLKLLSCSELLLANPNVGAEPKPVDEPCGALLLNSLSKAVRVVAFITFSS